MNFLYIDESGTASFKDKTPIFAIIGVDIDESKNRQLTYEYSLLKKTYFPRMYSTGLRSLPSVKDQVKMLKTRECKEILWPHNFCRPHKIFMYKVIKLCEKYEVKLFGAIARKDALAPRANPDWLYPACLKIVTTCYNICLESRDDRGMIIMDARGDALDDHLTFIQSTFLLWGKEGRRLDKVVDLPFFAPSHLSAALQIAHYFSYISALHYKYIYNKDSNYAYLTPLWQSMASLFYGSPRGKEIVFWR